MLNFFLTIYCFPIFVRSVSVQIDGFIDLSANSTNQHITEPLNRAFEDKDDIPPVDNKTNRRYKKKYTVMEAEPIVKRKRTKPKTVFEETHDIKQSDRINEFTYHVYKQSLMMFEEIKKKCDPAIASKLEAMARKYGEKFKAFIRETLNQKIKTRLGSQKVILNTIDTSSQILRRLMNHFRLDMKRKRLLRTHPAILNIFQKEVDRENNLERLHACSKYGICRTSYGFSEFLIDFITIILQCDLTRIKQSADALTEVLKNTHLNNIMNGKNRIKFKHNINKVEKMDAGMIQFMFIIVKNIIAHKNKPIVVMAPGNEFVNRRVALLEVVDVLDSTLPPSAENTLEWADLKASLNDWKDGKRHDILEIMQGLVSHMKRGLDRMDDATAQNLNDKFNVLIK